MAKFQTYGQIPDIWHMPDSGYLAACLPDPDQDQISKNANIQRTDYLAQP